MATTFSFCETERAVLSKLYRYAASEIDYDRHELVEQAEERLKELRAFERATDAAAADIRLTASIWDRYERKTVTPPKPPPAQAAVIELVEDRPAPSDQDHLGVMKPNVLKINGTPVLVPAEDFIEIEGLEYDPKKIEREGLIVRVRMFARRVVIGEA